MSNEVVTSYTRFGITLDVVARAYNMDPDEKPDEVMFIEHNADMYALQSPQLKDKRILLVYKSAWEIAYNQAVRNLVEDKKITPDDVYWDINKVHDILKGELCQVKKVV